MQVAFRKLPMIVFNLPADYALSIPRARSSSTRNRTFSE